MEARTRESLERAMARGREQAFEEMERALASSREGKEAETLMEARTRESLERAVARGIAQGIAQGRAEGERMLLRRQAERRFGAETAAQLSDLLADVEEPEDLIESGEWIVDCHSGDELLERCRRLHEA